MHKKLKSFGWDLCYTCNFKCSYCGVWKDLDKTYVEYDLGKWELAWNRTHEQYGRCFILLSGGEPSTFPGFFELLEILTQKHQVCICTNLDWDYERVIKKYSEDDLCLMPAFHPYNNQLDSFMEKIMDIQNHLLRLYFIVQPGNTGDLIKTMDVFSRLGLDLFPTPMRAADSFKILNSAEEQSLIRDLCPPKYAAELEYLLLKESPKDKICSTGRDYAMLRPDGTVNRCPHYKEEIGNFFDQDFKLDSCTARCGKDFCLIPWYVE